jgi:uncharacterized membrane protein
VAVRPASHVTSGWVLRGRRCVPTRCIPTRSVDTPAGPSASPAQRNMGSGPAKARCSGSRREPQDCPRRPSPWYVLQGANRAFVAVPHSVGVSDDSASSSAPPSPAPPGLGAHLPFHLRQRLGLLGHATAKELNELAHAHVPAWLRPTAAEPAWPIAAAVVVAIILQLVLPRQLSLSPRELLPGLEAGLLFALVTANPKRLRREHRALRAATNAMIGLITLANAASAALLAHRLVSGQAGNDSASDLLLSGGSIYLTNIIAFGLWYWEHDRGGPFARSAARQHHPDFLFPQMAAPDLASHDWEPRFLDYLYLSFTNATAFSPTDTLPMSRWAKALMAAQSAVSLVTVALVVARAVNILK